LTVGNNNSHEIINDNAVRVVNLSTQKYQIITVTMFPHYDIRK